MGFSFIQTCMVQPVDQAKMITEQIIMLTCRREGNTPYQGWGGAYEVSWEAVEIRENMVKSLNCGFRLKEFTNV